MFKSPSRNAQNQGITTVFQFASNTLARKRLGRQITEEMDPSSHIPLHRKVNLKRVNSSPNKLKSTTIQKRNAIAAAAADNPASIATIRKVNKKVKEPMRGIQDFKRRLYNSDILQHLGENAAAGNQSPKQEKVVHSQ